MTKTARSLRVVAFCMLLAGSAHAAPTPTDVRAGIAAWTAGNSARAVAIWRPLAAAGNADAQFNLAQAYKLGRGVPLDLASAQTWYERAARQGHHDAQTSLGLALFGNGDRIGAMRWLRLAADGGEPRAMLLYGTALFNGDDMAPDRVRAFALVSRAAAQGLAPAIATLKDMDAALSLAERRRGTDLALQMASSRAPSGPTAVPSSAGEPPRPTKPILLAKVAPPPIRVAPGGDWRIQLGAFSQRSGAEALYRRLAASGALSGRSPSFIAAGPVTRLQIGPYASRASASAACASLSGQACFPVR